MTERKKYVFDTSSLSHAFEDFTHSLGSVIGLCIEKGIPPEKCDVPRYIRNRAKSTGGHEETSDGMRHGDMPCSDKDPERAVQEPAVQG
jgi:hypothetical protein